MMPFKKQKEIFFLLLLLRYFSVNSLSSSSLRLSIIHNCFCFILSCISVFIYSYIGSVFGLALLSLCVNNRIELFRTINTFRNNLSLFNHFYFHHNTCCDFFSLPIFYMFSFMFFFCLSFFLNLPRAALCNWPHGCCSSTLIIANWNAELNCCCVFFYKVRRTGFSASGMKCCSRLRNFQRLHFTLWPSEQLSTQVVPFHGFSNMVLSDRFWIKRYHRHSCTCWGLRILDFEIATLSSKRVCTDRKTYNKDTTPEKYIKLFLF